MVVQQIQARQESNTDLVSTIFYGTVIERPNSASPISETDLENYVAEAAWKTYDKFRAETAKRLKVGEMDLVLKSVMVMGVKIDGHRVINPVGFRAKKIEVTVLVTISKKSFSCSSLDCFDQGTLNAYIVGETDNEEASIYAEIGAEKTDIYVNNYKKTSHVGAFPWGEIQIIKSIEELFLGDHAVSQLIFERYLRGEVSLAVKDKINKCFYGELKTFLSGLSDMTLKTAGLKKAGTMKIFVKSKMLPIGIEGKPFLFNSKRVRITDVGIGNTVQEFLDQKDKLYGPLNESVVRRMKWIEA